MKETGKTMEKAADLADMSEKTARKYLKAKASPIELQKEHDWITRDDPFEEFWPEIQVYLENEPGLEAKATLDYLQRNHPGIFHFGQLRTLQRKFRRWRALEGYPKEIFFEQIHYPGILGQSDFTEMDSLGITIRHELFRHMLFHYVLTYSNWETGNICFSESFESLSEGLQAAWWELGGVPKRHRTDNLSAAVNKECNPEIFTDRYKALLGYYGVEGEKIQPEKANENGDVEQRHYRFKKAVKQALIFRQSNDFNSIDEYKVFLRDVFKRQNSPRLSRFQEELKKFRVLPKKSLDSCREEKVWVSKGSTIVLDRNIYSIDSRLIGEQVKVKIFSDRIEVFYASRKVEEMPRLRGKNKHSIQYRHIIDWLIRKPGAFENYRFRDDLYPTTRFRMYYDRLRSEDPLFASRRYLEILLVASQEGEGKVDQVLKGLLERGATMKLEGVREAISAEKPEKSLQDVHVDPVDLFDYDTLLGQSSDLLEAAI